MENTSKKATAGRPKNNEKREVRNLLICTGKTLLNEYKNRLPTYKEIAEYAGVSPAMINYYFLNRKEYYEKIGIGQ